MCHQSRLTLFIATLVIILIQAPAGQAAFVSPGNGSVYSMDSLVAQSGGVVTGSAGSYQVLQSVIISATDRLDIAPGQSLTFPDVTGLVGLEIRGELQALGTAEQPILITGSQAVPGTWRGLDFNDTAAGSQFHLAHVEIAYAMIGVDVFGADIQLENCEIHHCQDKALDFSQAGGTVTDGHLHHNQQRTVVMTLSSSPTFADCLLEHNNQANSSPYPYFNIGLQGVNSPTIRGCTITGDGNEMSGGMAIWNSSNALIENNSISGCGYGILCYSVGANPTISGNTIFDNTIHPDQVNWGFGVACNGVNAPILMNNTITGHWYGVAAINGGQPNLGDLVNDFPGDDGLNHIQENGLGTETYGFYNNTPLSQMAQNNFWGPVGAEDSIYHQPDDPSLGLVNFEPVAVSSPVGDIPGLPLLSQVKALPNPFNPRVAISFNLAADRHVSAVVFDMAGKLVAELQAGTMPAGEHSLNWDGTDRKGQPVNSGIYFYRIVAGSEYQTGKLTLIR